MATPDTDTGALESENVWRRMYNKLLGIAMRAYALLIAIIGLLVLGLALTRFQGQTRAVGIEVAASLMLFGVTTLFITIAASQALDARLTETINDTLTKEKTAVTDILDKERQEIVELTIGTHKAVKESQEDLKPLGGNWRALGLTNVYLTRTDALAKFGEHIREELRRASRAEPAVDAADATETAGGPDQPGGVEMLPDPSRCRLWIAASSMKGLLEAAGKDFDGLGMFTWAADLARKRQLDLRIIMTHPHFARVRANQEDRGENAIPEEIQEAVNQLRRQKVPPQRVKMVFATPTVFAIATRDQMLLNPYPYSQEAYRSFTLTVRRSHMEVPDHRAFDRDIFEQYERRHFLQPWFTENAQPLTMAWGIPARPAGTPAPPARTPAPPAGSPANQVDPVELPAVPGVPDNDQGVHEHRERDGAPNSMADR